MNYIYKDQTPQLAMQKTAEPTLEGRQWKQRSTINLWLRNQQGEGVLKVKVLKTRGLKVPESLSSRLSSRHAPQQNYGSQSPEEGNQSDLQLQIKT